MKVKMLKPRNALKAGQEATLPGGVAKMWIRQGVCERMVPETVVTIMGAPKRSGRTRSRKRVTA